MSEPKDSSPPGWLDGFAVATSALCLAHCLALPVVAAALPAIGALGSNELVHWLLLAVALPVSLWALTPARGGAIRPLAIGAAGLTLMIAGVAIFPATPAERWLSIAGAMVVASAHILRWSRARR